MSKVTTATVLARLSEMETRYNTRLAVIETKVNIGAGIVTVVGTALVGMMVTILLHNFHYIQ